MQNINIAYDTKAEKQFSKLDIEVQNEIMQAITHDSFLFDQTGNLRSVYSGYTGNFWWVSSNNYRILIRVELNKQRILIMDISRKRHPDLVWPKQQN